MITGEKKVKVYPWNCTCGRKLYFEESDFRYRCLWEGTASETFLPYIKTPCPDCGRVWDNLSINSFSPIWITPA